MDLGELEEKLLSMKEEHLADAITYTAEILQDYLFQFPNQQRIQRVDEMKNYLCRKEIPRSLKVVLSYVD